MVANQPPTADFSTEVDDLKLSVDAAASTDADGTIADYAWDFGDGATGSGVTDSHTYAASGSYEVKLTVTDNDGATDTSTKTVTVTLPPNDSAAGGVHLERQRPHGQPRRIRVG